MSEMATLPGLGFDPNPDESSPVSWQGATERETRQAIAEIEANVELTGVKRTLKQLAISLAVSIDKGNAKGRAVANEAQQLFAMMQQLDPADDGGPVDDSHLTAETRRLLDAFAAPAQLDSAPVRDGEEL